MKAFLYVIFFIFILVIGKTGATKVATESAALHSSSTHYNQVDSPKKRTMDYLLAHNYTDISNVCDYQLHKQLDKFKYLLPALCTLITRHDELSVNTLHSYLLTENQFLIKNSHYIFFLRKIII